MEQENRTQEPKNKIWQTRLHEQTAFERRLAEAMESAFADGVTELDELVDRLNQGGVFDEQNRAWTIDSFRAVMAELGA
jgi:ribosome assembly protein YihI (activator of Der GTPase)